MPDEIEKADDDAAEKTPERVMPEEESDRFDEEEQKEIVKMVIQDAENDIIAMSDWTDDRVKDLQRYEGERPSVIEHLVKEEWMSDRNLGLCAATCDAYQATLLSTCYNLDMLHFKASEENDRQNAENLETFARWGLSKQEADAFGEIDDFIHNRITQGIGYLKVYWKVWYETIDRRIPKYSSVDPEKFIGYEIKTETKRFEKGIIENIDDVSDLLMPTEGDDLQSKDHVIHIIRTNSEDLLEQGENGWLVNVDEEFVKKLKQRCYENQMNLIGDEKSRQLGLTSWDQMTSSQLRTFPIRVFEWYGKYKKGNKAREEYRFRVDPLTKTFLSGKPLRKISRSGKRPFVGKGMIRRPGRLQGKSVPRLIAHVTDQINNIYNQKADFQFFQNCPFGWFRPDNASIKQEFKIVPGMLIPNEEPDKVNIPNLSRSMAWAESDIRILFEVLERMTGAASFFMTNRQNAGGTATRDMLINEKSEQRFGLWVNRIIDDLDEAITMWIQMYQDWAPPDLGERILGEDGRQLFRNFSVETLRGNYDAYLTPDLISGSKAYKREVAMWGLQTLSVLPWLNPQLNPAGNWQLTVDAARDMGFEDVERYMPPKPAGFAVEGEVAKRKFQMIKQGQRPEIEPGDDPVEIFVAFSEMKSNKYKELDPEYQPVFDSFLFRAYVESTNLIQKMQHEQIANRMALGMVMGQKPVAGGAGGMGMPGGGMMGPGMDEGVPDMAGSAAGAGML